MYVVDFCVFCLQLIYIKKMTQTLLLGAGASVPAGIPTANGMVRDIYGKLKTSTHIWPQIGPAIDLVLGGIKFRHAVTDSDPFSEVDIEEVYATLIDLSHRNTNRLAPFIGSWTLDVSNVDSLGLNNRSNLVVSMLEQDLAETHRSVLRNQSTSINLARFRKALDDIFKIIDGRVDYSNFKHAADFILELLIKNVWVENPNKLNYLKPLLESSRVNPMWIATLNYDNSIELLSKELGLSCDIGLSNNRIGVDFDGAANIKLAKLHGSVNWSINENLAIDVGDTTIRNPALIFGLGEKLRVEGPYLDLLLSFRDRLTSTTKLDIYGYSFRDSHVNYLILSWVSQNKNAVINVIDPNLSFESIMDRLDSMLGGSKTVSRAVFSNRMKVHSKSIETWITEGLFNG